MSCSITSIHGFTGSARSMCGADVGTWKLAQDMKVPPPNAVRVAVVKLLPTRLPTRP